MEKRLTRERLREEGELKDNLAEEKWNS